MVALPSKFKVVAIHKDLKATAALMLGMITDIGEVGVGIALSQAEFASFPDAIKAINKSHDEETAAYLITNEHDTVVGSVIYRPDGSIYISRVDAPMYVADVIDKEEGDNNLYGPFLTMGSVNKWRKKKVPANLEVVIGELLSPTFQ